MVRRRDQRDFARQHEDPREELLHLLRGAAEIEHLLTLQYLYAGYSVRERYAQSVVGRARSGRGKAHSLSQIALEEMMHLKEVNQLRVDLGGSPHFDRPDFPFRLGRYPFDLVLEPLTQSSIAKYIYAEAPQGVFHDPERGELDEVERALSADTLPSPLGSLYRTIKRVLDELDGIESDERIRRWHNTIDHIIHEGEHDHFEFFLELFHGDAALFGGVADVWNRSAPHDPSRPLIRVDAERETDTRVKELAHLSNETYWATLLLLRAAYGSRHARLLRGAAVTLMTDVIDAIGGLLAARDKGIPFDKPNRMEAGETADILGEAITRIDQARALADAYGEPQIQAISGTLSGARRSVDDVRTAHTRVVVIGAGPAGLAAAWALAGNGLDVHVVHRGNVTGGKAESLWVNGRSTDHGVHGWWPGYVNFDRMLRDVGVDLDDALAHATGTGVLSQKGELDFVEFSRMWLPFPWFLLVYVWRPRLYPRRDLLSLFRFSIHLLAFDHSRDYERYDDVSLDAFSREVRLKDTIRESVVAPFATMFDYASAKEVSAASILSAMQFYLLPSQHSIVPRWSRGLANYKIFSPIEEALKKRGVTFYRPAEVTSIDVQTEGVASVTIRHMVARDSDHASEPETLVASIPRNAFPGSGENFAHHEANKGPRLLIGHVAGQLTVYGVCTHEQGQLRVCPNGLFECEKHGGRFRPNGDVERGPPRKRLMPERIEDVDGTVNVYGVPSRTIPCEHVVIATDVRSARSVLEDVLKERDQELRDNLAQLDATSVVVLRLWFKRGTKTPGPQTIVLPRGEFADVYFDMGQIDGSYDGEGVVIELHSADDGDAWSERTDEEVLAAAFRDLRSLSAEFIRDRLLEPPNYEIRRHKDTFTLYAPNRHHHRPGADTSIAGLHLAGDWTQADTAVWMMERGVTSGLRAANRVLEGHKLAPVEVLAPPTGGLARRIARTVARALLWVRGAR